MFAVKLERYYFVHSGGVFVADGMDICCSVVRVVFVCSDGTYSFAGKDMHVCLYWRYVLLQMVVYLL